MDRTTLLAAGVTLFVLGIILRGLEREHRRTLAHRKQHELANPQPDKAPVTVSHFEKHFARYANGVFTLGMVLSIAAAFL